MLGRRIGDAARPRRMGADAAVIDDAPTLRSLVAHDAERLAGAEERPVQVRTDHGQPFLDLERIRRARGRPAAGIVEQQVEPAPFRLQRLEARGDRGGGRPRPAAGSASARQAPRPSPPAHPAAGRRAPRASPPPPGPARLPGLRRCPRLSPRLSCSFDHSSPSMGNHPSPPLQTAFTRRLRVTATFARASGGADFSMIAAVRR